MPEIIQKTFFTIFFSKYWLKESLLPLNEIFEIFQHLFTSSLVESESFMKLSRT